MRNPNTRSACADEPHDKHTMAISDGKVRSSTTATAGPGVVSGEVLALGFGVTVAMWAVGYMLHLPFLTAPNFVVFFLLLVCMLAGGYLAGRLAAGRARTALYAGALTATLNLMVLGSLLAGDEPNMIVPSALLWVPGSYLFALGLAYAGALLGVRHRTRDVDVNWTCVFAWVAVSATFLLMILGGLVTSHDAGMAVLDWPSSFGYNMFLYPLSRMTGGIYYEHTHRLLGSLVGLTMVVLAIHLHLTRQRRWLIVLGYIAVVFVIVQGLLGGVRVTRDDINLAFVHGVLGQIFLCLTVAFAVFTMRAWRDGQAAPNTPPRSTDKGLTTLLVVLLVIQLILGASQRHLNWGLMVHIALAAVITCLAVAAGARAWGIYLNQPILQKAGLTVCALVLLQLCLGVGALITTVAPELRDEIPLIEALVTAFHQSMGALLLASTVFLTLWTRRVQAT